jgi:zinc transporter ZupT
MAGGESKTGTSGAPASSNRQGSVCKAMLYLVGLALHNLPEGFIIGLLIGRYGDTKLGMLLILVIVKFFTNALESIASIATLDDLCSKCGYCG